MSTMPLTREQPEPEELQVARGAVTVEVSLLLVAVAAAFVSLAIYTQRAIQGNLFEGSQFVGLQFDPRGLYTETQGLHLGDTVHQNQTQGMMEAEIIKTKHLGSKYITAYAADPKDPNMALFSLPSGPVPREPAGWGQVKATSSWKVNSNATYNVQN